MLRRGTRKVTASCQQQKDSFSDKARRRSFECAFLCDKSENFRGPLRGCQRFVTAEEGTLGTLGWGKEGDTIVLTSYELDLWEELLK